MTFECKGGTICEYPNCECADEAETEVTFKLTKGGIRVPVLNEPQAWQCPNCKGTKQGKGACECDASERRTNEHEFQKRSYGPSAPADWAQRWVRRPAGYSTKCDKCGGGTGQPKPCDCAANVGNDERMYHDSGHQKVNPEVMKRVLNEHFGELNPETAPIVWTEVMVLELLCAAGVRTLNSTVDDGRMHIEGKPLQLIAMLLNNLPK